MKYRLNSLPVKTTNGFKINDVALDLELPKYHDYDNYQIKGDVSKLKIQEEDCKKKIVSKIGLDMNEYHHIEIIVPKDVSLKEPIFLSFDFLHEDAFYGKLDFLYEENSSCNFIIQLNSKDEGNHFSYLIENVISKKNSKGNITILNTMNSHSSLFYALENDVLESAEITHTVIDLGGKTRLYNVFSNVLEPKALNNLNTLYVGKEKELLDYHYYLNHMGCSTQNQMRVEGVLGDLCRKNFRGTIVFKKGCSHSIGEEVENCILLSDTCMSRSLPQMLCEEEDVFGTHGVSSGKVEEGKLFYLMSRGYNEKEAEKLIILGRFMHMITCIPSKEIQDNVISLIEEKIS